MSDATYANKVYHKQGSDELVVASGGTVTVESGGIIEIATGGDITANGVSLIDEIAALSGLDSGELAVLNGVTAGTVLAGKAVVTTTNKHIDALVISDGGLALGAGAGTAITSTAAELNLLDTAVAGSVVNSKAAIYDTAGKLARSSASPASAGVAVQADATLISAELNYVTGANGSKGVRLPVPVENVSYEIINSVTTAGNYLNVYPSVGTQINALGNDVAFQLNPGQRALFVGRSAILHNTAVASDTVSGLTASSAELNKTDGIPATGYLVAQASVLFTQTSGNGTYTGTIPLPAGSNIIDVAVHGIALWDASTSASMVVGDGSSANGFFLATDLKATDLLAGEVNNIEHPGGLAGAYIASEQRVLYAAGARNVIGVITQVGTGAAGRTLLVVTYATPTSAAATKV